MALVNSLTQSQLSYAISFLRANPKTRLVTITIGGDDLGLLQDICTAEFTLPPCKLVVLELSARLPWRHGPSFNARSDARTRCAR